MKAQECLLDPGQHGTYLFCHRCSHTSLVRFVHPFPQALQQAEDISFPQTIVFDLLLAKKDSREARMLFEAVEDGLPRFSSFLGQETLLLSLQQWRVAEVAVKKMLYIKCLNRLYFFINVFGSRSRENQRHVCRWRVFPQFFVKPLFL